MNRGSRVDIEEALGTVRGDGESWSAVYARVNSERGLDLKTITKVQSLILEVLDDQREEPIEIREEPIPKPSPEPKPEPTREVVVSREREPVSESVGGTEGTVEGGSGNEGSNEATD